MREKEKESERKKKSLFFKKRKTFKICNLRYAPLFWPKLISFPSRVSCVLVALPRLTNLSVSESLSLFSKQGKWNWIINLGKGKIEIARVQRTRMVCAGLKYEIVKPSLSRLIHVLASQQQLCCSYQSQGQKVLFWPVKVAPESRNLCILPCFLFFCYG